MDDVPLGALLKAAGRNRSVPLYANIHRRTTDRSPDGFRESASAAIADGFDAVKIAPFDGLTPDLCGTDEGRRLIAGWSGSQRRRMCWPVAPRCRSIATGGSRPRRPRRS